MKKQILLKLSELFNPKRILTPDGKFGRLEFLVSLPFMFVILLTLLLPFSFIYAAFGLNIYTKPMVIAAIAFMIFFIVYVMTVVLYKRLYDIFDDKIKSIFYTVAYWIISVLLALVHIHAYARPIFVGLVFLALIVIKGKKKVSAGDGEQNRS